MLITDIERNLQGVERRIARSAEKAGRSPGEVTIVAVTKNVAIEAIRAALQSGINNIGENRVQEARWKIESLSQLVPRPVWHMVGHLQTNKTKTAAAIFDIIHTIDSIRLAEAISHRASGNLPLLVQVNASGEGTKNGFSLAESA